MQTYSLLFYPKNKKGNSEMSIVYMRITVNGKRIEVSSGRTIKTKEWNCRKKGTLLLDQLFNIGLCQ